MGKASVQGAMRRVGAAGRLAQERLDSHAQAQLRHAPARSRRQPAADPAVPRPQQPADHDGLFAPYLARAAAGDRHDRTVDAVGHAHRRRRAAAARRGVSRALRPEDAGGAPQGPPRDHGLPHDQVGHGVLPLLLVRTHPCHGPLVRQPALPDLPARQDQSLARETARSPAAVPLLPAHLHASGEAAGLPARPSARRLRCPV